MNLHAQHVRRTAGAFAVAAAAASLVLSGCGKNTPSASAGSTTGGTSAGSTSAGSGSTASAAATTSASQASSVQTTGSAPFPTTVGDSWKYSNSNGTTSENTITGATAVSSGQQITMASAFTDNGTTTHDTFYYVVEPNGQIALPTSQFTSDFANTGATVKIVSGGIFWPSAAELASGQPIHTTLVMSLKVSGVNETITEHITSQGEGTQSVTVPAGTYNASVISVTETASIMGYTTDIDQKTWLANGVGPVQSELISVDGSKTSLSNKEELVSFTKG